METVEELLAALPAHFAGVAPSAADAEQAHKLAMKFSDATFAAAKQGSLGGSDAAHLQQ